MKDLIPAEIIERKIYFIRGQKVIVCNKDKEDLFYNRYSAVIPSKHISKCNGGFDKAFVDNHLKKLWNNKLQSSPRGQNCECCAI